MAWLLHHHFIDLPCNQRARRASRFRSGRPAGDCFRDCSQGIAASIGDEVTALLSRHGLHYAPVGEGDPWLWCLGGPDLYRRPLPPGYDELLRSGTCLDLHIAVCEAHQVVTAELSPYDLVPEATDIGHDQRRRSAPINLGEDPDAVVVEFLVRLEEWLKTILVLTNAS